MAKAPKFSARTCPRCKERIKVDAEICWRCQNMFSQDEIAKAVAAATRINRWAIAGCLSPFLLIGSCVAYVVADDPGMPKTVKASDPAITDVQSFKEAGHSSIDVRLGSGSGASIPFRAAGILDRAGRVIKAGATDVPAAIKTVTFLFTAPVVDGYGNESRTKVLQFTVKTADLKAIHYDKVSQLDTMEFAYDLRFGGPVGSRAAEEYCKEYASDSPHFCANIG